MLGLNNHDERWCDSASNDNPQNAAALKERVTIRLAYISLGFPLVTRWLNLTDRSLPRFPEETHKAQVQNAKSWILQKYHRSAWRSMATGKMARTEPFPTSTQLYDLPQFLGLAANRKNTFRRTALHHLGRTRSTLTTRRSRLCVMVYCVLHRYRLRQF